MSNIILKAENISKQYRLGTVGTGTLSHDMNRWWHKVRGKEDPYLKIGDTNDRSQKAESAYVWALKDINFEVNRGEVLGIIGKNGAGKSTLLKILSRVTGPTTGLIKTKGKIASLLEVGTGFHPEMTGRENVFLNGAILGMTKAEIKAKLEEIIDFSGCTRYIDTPVKRYSSGMRVRLAFAVAAFLEPDILVVDEVLAVGDAEFQKKAVGKMQDISRGEGRTVLFVSHNMGAIENLCTRTLVLSNGEICHDGGVAEGLKLYSKDTIGDHIFDLRNSKGRRGTGQIKINKIAIYSANQLELPRTGGSMKIKFEFLNPTALRKSELRLDFRIDDAFGNRITWFSTILSDHTDSTVCETMVFSCDKLALNEGLYYLTYELSKKGGVVHDWVHNAASFNVISGQFYANNARVPKTQGKVLMDFLIDGN